LIIAYVGKLIYIKKTLLQYFSESLVALFVVGGFVLVTCIVGSVAGPDQTLAAISMGALVRLAEVGGHQFHNQDWTTLLDSIR
jgi:hypothetical protein